MAHKSRVCYITIDVNDFDKAVSFWSAALGAKLEPFSTTGNSDQVYRRLKLPDNDIRLLLQLVPESKTCKTRVHIDIETDDTDAEAARIEKLGAKKTKINGGKGISLLGHDRSLRQRVLYSVAGIPRITKPASALVNQL